MNSTLCHNQCFDHYRSIGTNRTSSSKLNFLSTFMPTKLTTKCSLVTMPDPTISTHPGTRHSSRCVAQLEAQNHNIAIQKQFGKWFFYIVPNAVYVSLNKRWVCFIHFDCNKIPKALAV